MLLTTFQPDFIPLLKEVKDLGIVTMQPQFAKILQDVDVPAKSINEYADNSLLDLARTHAALGLLDYYKYDYTQNFLDTRQEFLLNNLPGYLYGRLGDIALVILCLDRINPELVLLHNDVEPMNRLLALWCKKHDKPCLHIPHAIYLDNSGRGPIGTDIHDLITASHIACSGEQQAQWYAERGAKPEQLYLTGLPKTDKFLAYNKDKATSLRLLNLQNNRPVVTYCSSWRQDTNLLGCHDGIEESYTEFLNTAKTLPELQYVVKTHPRGGNLEWHKQLAKDMGVKCVVTDQHIEVILAASDLVISYGASNVVLEAATHPYTRICIVGDEAAMPNDAEILKVKEGQLLDYIKLALTQVPYNYDKLLNKYFTYLDGKSYLRIANLIRSLHDAPNRH